MKNLHLIVSVISITLAGVAYGIAPRSILPSLFDFEVQTVDLVHVFRVIMMMYLAMVTLWILGIVYAVLWRTATIANVAMMAGLASGRFVSLVLDGYPSNMLLAGLFGELVLMLWGINNLRRAE